MTPSLALPRHRTKSIPAPRPGPEAVHEPLAPLLEAIRTKQAELKAKRRRTTAKTKPKDRSLGIEPGSPRVRTGKAVAAVSIPEIPVDRLAVTAKIDYLRVDGFNYRPLLPASIAAKSRLTRTKINPAWQLTVHDPTAAEIVALYELLGDAHIAGLEIAVDFTPRAEAYADREGLLIQTFRALAARFRPDDEMIHGAGLKGAIGLDGNKMVPFHTRLPESHESLVYGHRDEGQNAKLYLKRMDKNAHLPADQHRVRLETTITSFGGYELEFKRLSDLAGGRLRGTFAKVFRIIDRAEVRRPARFSPEELGAFQAKLTAAWARAGVNAVEQAPMSSEASPLAKKASSGRHLLPLSEVRLRRDVATNKAIGDALRGLDRKLTRAWK